MAHTLDQQRAVFRPTKHTAFFDDDDDDDDDDDFSDLLTNDDTSSMARSMASSLGGRSSTRADTLALAEFLASTSPDEFAKPSMRKQQRRASRLLTRLRKRPSTRSSVQTDNASVTSKGSHSRHYGKHIPLPAYQPPSLRDSGVYSEISDKDVHYLPPPPPVPPVPPMQNDLQMFPMPPPTVPARSTARPRRPAPLPEDVASAAIAAASQQYHDLRSVPPAALKRRSVVRARHVQVQTAAPKGGINAAASSSTHSDAPSACPHCRQHIAPSDRSGDDDDTAHTRSRRLSCPPAMASGDLQTRSTPTPDHDTLREMIARLEAQLAEERQSRQKLEQAMLHHAPVSRKLEHIAEERNRWKDDCQWMQTRIASSLSEQPLQS